MLLSKEYFKEKYKFKVINWELFFVVFFLNILIFFLSYSKEVQLFLFKHSFLIQINSISFKF